MEHKKMIDELQLQELTKEEQNRIIGGSNNEPLDSSLVSIMALGTSELSQTQHDTKKGIIGNIR
ncbi:hypothetical protein ACFSR6_02900 [Pedobacter vanadiisoli]|uniref:Bacteriocin-like protein n=1 Tax=Pedobacter vanadiisoli TaxID=1761975 RepID=A0ABW5MDV8_9SPHI